MPSRNQTKFLECHGTTHDWDEISVLKAPSYGIAADYRCTRCHGTKRVLISRLNGMVLSRQYNMPKDYKNPHVTKADYRKEWFDLKLKKGLKVVS